MQRRRLWSIVIVVLLLAAPPLAMAQRAGAFLGELTWPEAETRLRSAPLVIVPFGAGAKEHGPHLPLATDRLLLDYLLKVAVESVDVVVAPEILHGWFPGFRDFPGTDIDDPDLFGRYALSVARSLVRHGAQRIVFLNTGIGRSSGLPLAIAARELHTQHRIPTLLVSWDDLETPEVAALLQQRAGSHADELETSLMLALHPELVRMDKAVVDYGKEPPAGAAGYRPQDLSRRAGDPDYSGSGVFGDARLATTDKGQRALAIVTRQWLATLKLFATAPVVR
jgi:creatinine amidohydrolase